MILVRTIFHAKWGKADEVLQAMKEGVQTLTNSFPHKVRILSDLSGETYTLVVEAEHESLASWEQFRARMWSSSQFREHASPGEGLIVSGSQEYYTIEAEYYMPLGEQNE